MAQDRPIQSDGSVTNSGWQLCLSSFPPLPPPTPPHMPPAPPVPPSGPPLPPPSAPPQSPPFLPGHIVSDVIVNQDAYPSEVSWELSCDGDVSISGSSSYREQHGLPVDVECTLSMSDS